MPSSLQRFGNTSPGPKALKLQFPLQVIPRCCFYGLTSTGSMRPGTFWKKSLRPFFWRKKCTVGTFGFNGFNVFVSSPSIGGLQI